MRDPCHLTLEASLTFSMMHSSLGLLVSGHAQQGLSFLPSGPTGPSLGGVQGVSLAASILIQQTHSETSIRWLSLNYVEIILSSTSMIANSQTLKCIFVDLDCIAIG